jgi:3-oxoadipate enol-lactonase
VSHVSVLMLHPLGSDRSFWDDVLPHLEGLDVVAVDLPGHGGSGKLAVGAGISDFTDEVVRLLDPGAGTRFHVVGVSLGGLVAQDLAARHPELVDRLVLVDTVATYPEPMRRMWRDRAEVARGDGLEQLAGPMESMWFSDDFRAGNEAVVKQVRDVFLTMDPEGYARACEALESADTTGLVAAITSPTLIVCGSDDLAPFRDAAYWLEEQVADSALVWLEGAKHAAVLEQPDEFAAALLTIVG